MDLRSEEGLMDKDLDLGAWCQGPDVGVGKRW